MPFPIPRKDKAVPGQSDNTSPSSTSLSGVSSTRALALGIGLTVMSGVLLASMDALSKELSRDYVVLQVVWARYFFHAIIVLAVLSSRFGLTFLKARRPYMQLIRAICIVGVTLSLYTAIARVPLADAIAVQFFAPVLVTVLSMFFLGEKVGVHRISAVIVGFIGVLVIIRPGFDTNWYLFLPLLAALFLAIYLLITRLITATENPHSTQFYTTGVGAVVLTLAVPFFWQSPDAIGWALMVIMGLLGALGHFCIIKGLSYAPASILSPFLYAHVLWASVLSVAVFGDPATWATVLGIVLLIASGIYTWWREQKRGQKAVLLED